MAVAISLLVGTTLGLVAGYFRGNLEVAIGWVTDILLAFNLLGDGLRDALDPKALK